MDNNEKLKLYRYLSRFPIFAKSYTFKIVMVASTGTLIPLIALMVYLSLTVTFSLYLLLVVALATVSGMGITSVLLYNILRPISLTSSALQDYMKGEQLPKLPMGFEDSVGQLMTNIQYTIERLDSLIHSPTHAFTRDPLTGIMNRHAGEEHLRKDLARAGRENSRMLIAIVDVDNLKHINEQYGYQVGDVCLTHIVEAISENIRTGDWLARWEGDKFLMMLWNFNHDKPITVLQRIQQHSVKTPMGSLLDINLSIGACECTGEIDMEALLVRLNQVLMEVKHNGQSDNNIQVVPLIGKQQ